MNLKMFMRRILMASSFGVLLIPLLVIAATWRPYASIEPTPNPAIASVSDANAPTAHSAKPLAVTSGSSQRVSSNPKPTLANVEWSPFPLELPGIGTVLAAGCLVLPFAVSMWGLLRKQL
jgi:hypothetical protein